MKIAQDPAHEGIYIFTINEKNISIFDKLLYANCIYIICAYRYEYWQIDNTVGIGRL